MRWALTFRRTIPRGHSFKLLRLWNVSTALNASRDQLLTVKGELKCPFRHLFFICKMGNGHLTDTVDLQTSARLFLAHWIHSDY